jgi:hypothetical protein
LLGDVAAQAAATLLALLLLRFFRVHLDGIHFYNPKTGKSTGRAGPRRRVSGSGTTRGVGRAQASRAETPGMVCGRRQRPAAKAEAKAKTARAGAAPSKDVKLNDA